MAYLAIINMKTNRLLLPFHHPVEHTGVIGILHKTFSVQCPAKLLVVKQTRHHCSIDGIQTLDNQNTHTVLVFGNVGSIGLGSNLIQQVCQHSSDPNHNPVFLFLNSCLNKCVRDINNCNIPPFQCVHNTSQ